MNSKVLYFIGGVLVGCASTYFALKKRMEKQIDEEVANVKETYSKKLESAPKIDSKESDDGDEYTDTANKNVSENESEAIRRAKDIIARNEQMKIDIAKATSITESNGYANTHKTEYNLFSRPPKPIQIHNGIDEGEDLDIIDTTPSKDARGPYVLEPDQYSSAAEKFINEERDFDKVTLFFFDDGVLCSEDDEIITNVAETVGEESLRRIGEYEPDVVYVRNERDSTDYEIIRQYRDFMVLPDDN